MQSIVDLWFQQPPREVFGWRWDDFWTNVIFVFCVKEQVIDDDSDHENYDQAIVAEQSHLQQTLLRIILFIQYSSETMYLEGLPEPNPLVYANDPEIQPKLLQIRRKNAYDENEVKDHLWDYFTQQAKALVYQRFDNYPWSMIPLNNHRFAAACFFDCRKLLSLNREIKLTDFYTVLQRHLFPTTMKFKEGRQLTLEQDSKRYGGLRFDSQFESGNLHAAYRVGPNEYDLMMQNDTNSKGHTQWFYFSVENTVRNQVVTFNIINFVKCDSQFNKGQRPVIYSVKGRHHKNQSWFRGGTNISYFRNNLRRENSQTKTYYSLTFQYRFEFQNDKVYFAQCYPYTYTQLLGTIERLHRLNPKMMQVRELCKTISRTSCPVITIGSGRVAVLLMARQHPGETPSSFACEGALEFLLSNCQEADTMRNHFTFYVIPMVNPDGVIHGNYRCNLHGVDLNRIWIAPHRELHDSVFHIRDLIKQLQASSEMSLLLDFHGHSKKMNGFFYGNNSYDEQKLLPLIASTISKMISFRDCAFNVHESKKSTARVALQDDFKSGFTFTFEMSFYGYKSNGVAFDFTEQQYKQLGTDIMLSVYKLYERKYQKMNRLPKMITPQLNEELNRLLASVDLSNLDSSQQDESGSDSDPEEDALRDQELQSIVEPKKIIKAVVVPKRKTVPQVVQKSDKQTQTEISHFQNLMLDERVLQSIEEQIRTFRKSTTRQTEEGIQDGENQIGSQTDISLQQILGRMQVYHMRVSNKYEIQFQQQRSQITQMVTQQSKPLVIVLKNPYSIVPERKSQSRGRSAFDRLRQRQFSIQASPDKKSHLTPMSPANLMFQDATFEKIANISKLKFNKYYP